MDGGMASEQSWTHPTSYHLINKSVLLLFRVFELRGLVGREGVSYLFSYLNFYT